MIKTLKNIEKDLGVSLNIQDLEYHQCRSSAREIIKVSSDKAECSDVNSEKKLSTSQRSITRLNIGTSYGTSGLSLNKSMTRLNSSQYNMNRINPNLAAKSISSFHNKQAYKVVGLSSPSKSMSSGSMPGTDHILTVNVTQINQDLIRQVSTVLSSKDLATNLQSLKCGNHPLSSHTHLAPPLLQSSTKFRYNPPYHNSQPQSLGISSVTSNAFVTNASSTQQILTGQTSNTLPSQRRLSTHYNKNSLNETEEKPNQYNVKCFF